MMKEDILRELEAKAKSIWADDIGVVLEQARELAGVIADATADIEMKDYDKARQLIDLARSQEMKANKAFHFAFREARRKLRLEYNAAFGGRVWNEAAKEHFDSLVNRMLFVPPGELQSASRGLSEAEMRFAKEHGFANH